MTRVDTYSWIVHSKQICQSLPFNWSVTSLTFTIVFDTGELRSIISHSFSLFYLYLFLLLLFLLFYIYIYIFTILISLLALRKKNNIFLLWNNFQPTEKLQK